LIFSDANAHKAFRVAHCPPCVWDTGQPSLRDWRWAAHLNLDFRLCPRMPRRMCHTCRRGSPRVALLFVKGLHMKATPLPEIKLCNKANEVVEKLFSFCVHCLKDLEHPRDGFIQCNGCDELICYDCTRCLCERRRRDAIRS
jgi:hypothetical protein